MAYEQEKNWLPMFPKTPHLPLEPNATRDDLIVSEEELAQLLAQPNVVIEEKVDGANVGVTMRDGQPIIRNRLHILNKAFTEVRTPAKAQFTPIWTWYYNNSKKFNRLSSSLEFMPSVYGEWLFAEHSIAYQKLPDVFIAHGIYSSDRKQFLDAEIARGMLINAGFYVPPILYSRHGGASPLDTDMLISLRDGSSAYYDGPREGIYIKVSDGEWLTHRYKMVRPGFAQNEDWNKTGLVRNGVQKVRVKA